MGTLMKMIKKLVIFGLPNSILNQVFLAFTVVVASAAEDSVVGLGLFRRTGCQGSVHRLTHGGRQTALGTPLDELNPMSFATFNYILTVIDSGQCMVELLLV